MDSEGSTGAGSSLELNGAGHPRISYRRWGADGDLKYARWDDPGWHIETVTSAGNTGGWSSLALDDAEHPHISYYDMSYLDLEYARWDGSVWQIETVDDDTGSIHSYNGGTSLALNAEDYPHISYRDWGNQTLRYAYWEGSGWISETVDSSANVGEFSSLALDAAGHPHISYHDLTNGDLKYAHWDGCQWIFETMDSDGDVGEWTSLALDAAGHVHISYHDVTNDDLKYAYWDGSAWNVSIVDSEGGVGKYTSLALDAQSAPHISYYDDTNGDLKYARGSHPIPLTIDVYADKVNYSAGETMHVGLDMTTARPATGAPDSYVLIIMLRTPAVAAVVANVPLDLPPGWSYSNPDLFSWTLPALPPGPHTWIGMLVPVGEEAAVDHAFWQFTGQASGQRVVPIQKAIRPLRNVGLDFGE